MNSLYLVDSYSHIYRFFFGIRKLLSEIDGITQPTNAIFGIFKFLILLKKQYDPLYGAFVFDKGGSKYRTELFPEYKKNRASMPIELQVQLNEIRDIISYFGWKIIENEGYEADDLIATLTNEFYNDEIFIISNDKDLQQLLNNKIKILSTITSSKKYFILKDYKYFITKYNNSIIPSQLIDVMALVGDSVDNINGINGIGIKTAVTLIYRFNSIESMINNIDNIENIKLREKISNNIELIIRNKKLIVLNKSVKIKFNGDIISYMKQLKLNKLNLDKLYILCEKYKFYSLFSQIINLEIKR